MNKFTIVKTSKIKITHRCLDNRVSTVLKCYYERKGVLMIEFPLLL